MNITKTNPMALSLIESKFDVLRQSKKRLLKGIKEKESEIEAERCRINNRDRDEFFDSERGNFMVRFDVFNWNKNSKILRVTKNIVNSCALINIENIKENININDFNFDSLIIMLDNDKEGIIKVERNGSDFDFLYLKNLTQMEGIYFNTYSFLTKEYVFDTNEDGCNFVVKLLSYLYYGDITTKVVNPKVKINTNSFKSFLNNSKFQITYIDSLWRQRICSNGFKVSGHFRMQPFGESRLKRKLIWIEEFSKDGYNRKATVEIINKTT